ncbi:hypothetical protein [Sphingobacterium sp. ML3W]|uniref:hypothetical protein n=1 Tax=Sphingobacterium sp. ML3W TaxID=1538644 RepID=UPI000A43A7F8|nr:hypothetical protein [Sphingobacterium sp. ML3W]
MPLFSYTGTNPSQPNSYTLVTTTPTCGLVTEQMCTIEAANNGLNKPVITEALKDEIINCLQNQINDTHVKLTER